MAKNSCHKIGNILILLGFSLFSFCKDALAADITTTGSESLRYLIIEGQIQSGDYDRFIDQVKINQGKVGVVYLFSSGGDFYEAMKIGRAMRSLELASMAPMQSETNSLPVCSSSFDSPVPKDRENCICASACFFIHVGAIHRGGTHLAVHRPYFEKGTFGNLSEAAAKLAFDTLQSEAKSYMSEMDVPTQISELVLGTASDDARILNEDTVRTYLFGALPYRHEWVRNRCSVLSASENARMTAYSRRLLSSQRPALGALESSEQDDFSQLQGKQLEEISCGAKAENQSRLDAYRRFFGTSIDDVSFHDFSNWARALDYLGMRYDAVMELGQFSQEKFSNLTFLKQAATAQLPSLILSDKPTRPRVVDNITIYHSNPSDAFISRLVDTLDGKWGVHSGGEAGSPRVWSTSEFAARLEKSSIPAADGPYISLNIQAKWN